MPNDPAKLADAFLSRITEDETGIWELVDEAATQLPDMPAETRLALARAALDLLLTREFVIATRGRPFGNGDRLESREARAAIAEPEIWGSPEFTGNTATLMLDATATGNNFYFSGAKLATNEPG